MSTRVLRERGASAAIWILSLGVPALTVALMVGLTVRSLPILRSSAPLGLLLGTSWRPVAGEFGYLPFILATLWVTLLAMLLATPVCLLTALHLAEYARPRTRALVKPLIDVLAGIPSVVYGLFGVLVVVPAVKEHIAPFAAAHLSFITWLSPREHSTGYGVLAAGLVLAFMVAPFIIAVAEDALRAVPVGVREASLAIGATAWETSKHVSLRSALPGLVGAVVLGFSRALGETMAVLMVAGNVARIPQSIFDPAYPLPALIANNYGEMMSIPLYDAALLLAALALLVVVVAFNFAAQMLLLAVRRRAGAP